MEGEHTFVWLKTTQLTSEHDASTKEKYGETLCVSNIERENVIKGMVFTEGWKIQKVRFCFKPTVN